MADAFAKNGRSCSSMFCAKMLPRITKHTAAAANCQLGRLKILTYQPAFSCRTSPSGWEINRMECGGLTLLWSEKGDAARFDSSVEARGCPAGSKRAASPFSDCHRTPE